MSIATKPQLAQVGDRLPDLTFGPITRAQLGLYAGASLDHNPIHIDLDFARASGQDDVFAHGMLGMAQFGRMLTGWAAAEDITHLSARFTAIVPVGATLSISGQVTARDEAGSDTTLTIALEALLDDGICVLKGQATVLASPDA